MLRLPQGSTDIGISIGARVALMNEGRRTIGMIAFVDGDGTLDLILEDGTDLDGVRESEILPLTTSDVDNTCQELCLVRKRSGSGMSSSTCTTRIRLRVRSKDQWVCTGAPPLELSLISRMSSPHLQL